jgi:hypothetical protein
VSPLAIHTHNQVQVFVARIVAAYPLQDILLFTACSYLLSAVLCSPARARPYNPLRLHFPLEDDMARDQLRYFSSTCHLRSFLLFLGPGTIPEGSAEHWHTHAHRTMHPVRNGPIATLGDPSTGSFFNLSVSFHDPIANDRFSTSCLSNLDVFPSNYHSTLHSRSPKSMLCIDDRPIVCSTPPKTLLTPSNFTH